MSQKNQLESGIKQNPKIVVGDPHYFNILFNVGVSQNRNIMFYDFKMLFSDGFIRVVKTIRVT